MNLKKFFQAFLIETLLVLVLIALSFGIFNPYWMPMGMQLLLLVALVVLFGFFAVFLWREQGGDERERLLRHMSDRTGFLAGGSVLLIALVVDTYMNHYFNPWILGALAALIIGKVASFIYHNRNNQ